MRKVIPETGEVFPTDRETNRLLAWLWVIPFIVIAVFFYYLTWLPDSPLLDGDDAIYMLMADHFSPFSDRGREITSLVMRHSTFPPLYPLLLGILGGTSAQLEIAHAITTTFLLLALALYFLWMRRELGRTDLAGLLSVVFVFLPVTILQSLNLLSENLYLLLSLFVMVAAMHAKDDRWHFLAALAVGLLLLTRTIGIALAAAYAIVLFSKQRQRCIPFIAIALTPLFAWTIWKWAQGYYGSYFNTLLATWTTHPFFDVLWLQITTAIKMFWTAWVISIDESPSLVVGVVAGAVLGVCLAGLLYRLRRLKVDALYVVFYLGIVAIWPYGYEARRFLYVVIPIMLFHGIYLIHRMAQIQKSAVVRTFVPYAFVFALALAVFPSLGLISSRFLLAQTPEYRHYANSSSWYSYEDLHRAIDHASERNQLVQAWRQISERVAPDECVYHIKPVALALYADRLSYETPYVPSGDRARFLERAPLCRYFYLGAFTYYPYNESFYPEKYLRGLVTVVTIDRLEGKPGNPVLGMLVERNVWAAPAPPDKTH